MNPIFRKDFHVRAYEIDTRGRVQPLAILNYLQDTAGDHAHQLEVSIRYISERQLTWVISHYHLQILFYPRYGSLLTVSTWPSVLQGKETCRDFRVTDARGQTVARASTGWRLLRTDTFRPVPIEANLPPYPIHPERALETAFPHLPEPDRIDLELPFRVRMSDMDINQHVNNAHYAAWALETVPEPVLRNSLPTELEIHFRSAAVYGDRVLSRTRQLRAGDTPEFLHQLVSDRDGRELTRLRTRWAPAETLSMGPEAAIL